MNSLLAIAQSIGAHPLTRDAQLGAWARFATWQVRSRLNREVVMPWVGGQRLIVRRGMTGATGNLYFGLHEFMSMGFVLHFLREGDLFLDAGANIGSYTLLASGICRATTLAIEADADTSHDLARNIEINGLANLAKVLTVALGPSDGEAFFTTGRGAMNQVVSTSGENVRVVPQRSLDNIVGDDEPAMLKLDVEGFEEQVLSGAPRLLKKPGFKAILLEGTSPQTLKLFEAHGFERAFYDPFTRLLQRTPNELAFSNGQWTLSNEFFVRDWDFVENRIATAKPVTIFGRKI